MMTDRSGLERLAAARPAILDDTAKVLDAAEEDSLFRRIITAPANDPVAAEVRPPGKGRIAWRRSAAAAWVAAGVLIVVGAVALSSGLGSNLQGTSRSSTKRSSAVASLRLATYRFNLPPGFTTDGASCTPASAPSPGNPVTVLQGFAYAASNDGGCLEAALVAGTSVVPDDAQPVEVGSAQGYETSTSTSATLYVAVAGAGHDHYLVLNANGLTPAQLVSIAASGFPT